MKPGDKCTVKHHYGHTDTEKVMTILEIGPDTRMNSGTAVKVDGLEMPVDSGLIVLVDVKDEPKCVMGCKYFTGGEIKHHKDCPFYADSLSNYYDDLENDLNSIKSENSMLADKLIEVSGEIENLYPLIFKGQQWAIWDTLSEKPITTKQIVECTGLVSKNVSSQLRQMSKTGLIKFNQTGKLKSYYK